MMQRNHEPIRLKIVLRLVMLKLQTLNFRVEHSVKNAFFVIYGLKYVSFLLKIYVQSLKSRQRKKRKVNFVNYRMTFPQNNFLSFLLRETTMK